jgi:hypothetical protein
LLRILCEDIIFVAATAAAEFVVVSTPGLTPSSNVTDFFVSIELAPVSVVEVDAPKIVFFRKRKENKKKRIIEFSMSSHFFYYSLRFFLEILSKKTKLLT